MAVIDIHSHILFGVDDGASNLEQSVAMARSARADGITDMVATPHSSTLPPEVSAPDLRQRVQTLQAELDRQGVQMKLYSGLENYLDLELGNRLDAGLALPIASGPYVLVELPLLQYPLYAEQAFFALQVKGLVPVLAHPERNSDICRNHGLLEKLVERGVLSQVTAGSLLGAFGGESKRAAETFIRRRLAHVIASDAHGASGHRAPALSAALDVASHLVGKERAQAMVTTVPRAILDGARLTPEPPLPARRRFSLGG